MPSHLGGRLQEFRTAKQYFAALFERGVTPLRLGTDEERARFNDMLRTTMTGGISRALTSEFRSFLLKQEGGLGDTLVRMRGNLDACRRTRTEVAEAQELEREISGIYEAGHGMFAAALLAIRERAEELRRRVADARQQRDGMLRERDSVALDLQRQTEERTSVSEQLERAKLDYETAQRSLEQVVAANAIAHRVIGFERQLGELRTELGLASSELNRAESLRRLRAAERKRAEETFRHSAEGLADFQQGLEELHRRADAHRTAKRRVEDARVILGVPDLSATELFVHQETTEAAIAVVDRKRNELDVAISGADAHRIEHREAMQALVSILREDVAVSDAHSRGRTALRLLSELEPLAARVTSSDEELRRVRDSHQRQEAVRAAATVLSSSEESLKSSSDIREALRKAESQARSLEQASRDESAQAQKLDDTRQVLKDTERELRTRAARGRELDTVALRLEATLGTGLRTPEELETARQLLDEERDRLQRELEHLQTARDQTTDHARSLEQTGGVFHTDLLTARDLVGGELLASHFDDVDLAQAGQIEARLGPLAEAIVVQDTRDAATRLVGRDRELNTIWLVEEGGLHDLITPSANGTIELGPSDVTVEQHSVVRTTRVPSSPTLGRRARQRRVAELLKQAEEVGVLSASCETQLTEIASRRRDTALLTREVAILQRGNPHSELLQLEADLRDTASRLEMHRAGALDLKQRAARFADRADKLRDLLSEAFLLDEPDLSGRIAELEAALQSGLRAGTELARVAAAREVLGNRIDVLRRVPITESELSRMVAELDELSARRERLFRAVDALRYVVANQDALGWDDAEKSLSMQQELVPALKAQCDQAERDHRLAVESAESADQAWEAARVAWREVDDKRSAIEASREQAHRELRSTGVEDPSDAAVTRARSAAGRLQVLVGQLDRTDRELEVAIGRLAERLNERQRELDAAEEHLAKEEKEWKPADELWERLRARAEATGLVTPAITSRLLESTDSSVKLRTDARSKATQLEERLSTARGGDEILQRIRPWLSGQEQTTGDDFLQAWESVRDWLRRRVPAQVAEVDDPLEALERLRHRLKGLAARLEAQEAALRGASEDVARGIDVHIRSAYRQVQLLNRELEGVRFGTIRRMQIQLSRDDRMDGVLRALKEGSAQELLFAPTMPIEEALDTLFTRFGGRGPTVGQRLLDYREYIDVGVEIQRQTSTEWERVNPSRVSTGEAIGIGAALMMVVLTAWERAANLFRAKRSLGTLRLLFLDEANRLSHDNLGVLFELCTVLDLQLLIAAPEVARAPGCTTYRLVRRETADGGEEVIVSGRRSIAGT